MYKVLGHDKYERANRYQKLFDEVLAETKVNEIRCAINRSWVLGDDTFKLMLEKKSGIEIILNNWGGVRSAEQVI